jgi:hypothetical protein
MRMVSYTLRTFPPLLICGSSVPLSKNDSNDEQILRREHIR